MRSVKRLLRYGSKNWVINLTFVAIDRIDLVIVGAFVGMASVTYYSIGASLIEYAWSASAALALAFTPHLVHLDASGSETELKRLFLRGERLVGLFSSIAFAGALVFGTSFIDLWLGESYVSGPFGRRSDTIMSVLALANLPRVYQGIARQLLFATHLHKRLMYIMLAEALGNIALSLVLVRGLGPIGVALGTLIPCLISHGIVLPAYVLKSFGIRIGQYLRDGIGPPLLVAAVLYLAGTAVVRAVTIDSWPRFILAGFAFVGFGVLLSIGIGMTRHERASAWAWLASGRLQQRQATPGRDGSRSGDRRSRLNEDG
jgi:O-antigen/teichoic acid export membrane protein